MRGARGWRTKGKGKGRCKVQGLVARGRFSYDGLGSKPERLTKLIDVELKL